MPHPFRVFWATRDAQNLKEVRHEHTMMTEKNYRISGHETFPCRYTWLPKAVRGLSKNPQLFSDEDQAMVDLGVGKNMVRAIRYRAQAAGVGESSASRFDLSETGLLM